MKMKSTLAVTVISLTCLFALFHSCHGIACYKCHSYNRDNEACETITDDKFLHNYGHTANKCMKMLMFKKHAENGTTERLLDRGAFGDGAITGIADGMKAQRERGYEVKFSYCAKPKCNKD